MSYISVMAKVNAYSKKMGRKCKIKQIDRTETTFGGKGILTKEQYEKGMALSKKMKHMSSW